MSQPIQPASGGHLPPPIQPPQPQPSPFPPIQRKQKKFGWVALIITALVSLGIGGAVAGSGDGTTTALPAPTVTTTVTEPPVEGGGAPTTQPEPEPEPTKKKAAGDPYKVTITKCARGEFGFDVVVKITNNTDIEQTYLFDVGLYDSKGNTVGSGFGSVEVRPGKSGTTDTLASLNDPEYKGKVRCEVKITDF